MGISGKKGMSHLPFWHPFMYIIMLLTLSFFIQLLVALKVRYHQRITILRGNHESRQVFLTSSLSLPDAVASTRIAN